MKKYYGEQTQLALKHFKIGEIPWPKSVIIAQALIKYAASSTNAKLGELSSSYAKAISRAAGEIVDGKLDDQFPLRIWQSGSGTQFNMNVNEVIASRANEILTGKINGKSPIHPNDHVNMSQSTNDTVPTALHIAALLLYRTRLAPVLKTLEQTLLKKSKEFKLIKKVGRTHLQDAVTITLGEEFSGYAAQVAFSEEVLKSAFQSLREVPIGGTAVGTGLNTPKGFRKEVVRTLSKLTGLQLNPAKNAFESMAQHTRLVNASASLKTTAITLMKIANDIRFLGSGPRAGLGELILPANEPGSSIMPGKVNPTQSEALMMICAKVVGNDAALVAGEMTLSNFELQVAKPLFAVTLIESLELLADAVQSFEEHCVSGIQPNIKRLKEYEGKSLFAATALSKSIGYEKAAELVKKELEKER